MDPGHYVYRTTYPDTTDKNVEKIIKWALKRKHVTLIFDEINNFCNGSYAMKIVSKALREGRSKFVRIIAGSQFPVKVPEEVVSQATMAIIFLIPNPHHRKRLADTYHPGLAKEPEGQYSFFLWKKAEPRLLRHIRQAEFKDRRFKDQSEQDEGKQRGRQRA